MRPGAPATVAALAVAALAAAAALGAASGATAGAAPGGPAEVAPGWPPGAGPGGRAEAASVKPTAVGVGEREWRISLYRSRVPTGRVRFNVRNFGEDGHDLAVRTRSGRVLGALAEIRPGETDSLTLRLRRAGRYIVFCSLEGHEARGMRAVLRAKRR